MTGRIVRTLVGTTTPENVMLDPKTDKEQNLNIIFTHSPFLHVNRSLVHVVVFGVIQLSGSSLESPQSLSPSQNHETGIHPPPLQRNSDGAHVALKHNAGFSSELSPQSSKPSHNQLTGMQVFVKSHYYVTNQMKDINVFKVNEYIELDQMDHSFILSDGFAAFIRRMQ